MLQNSASMVQNSHPFPTFQPPREDGSIGPSMQTNHHHDGITMTRMRNMEFPCFNGINLRDWLCKVENFFFLDEIDYTKRVKVAFNNFDDIAIEWNLAYIRSRNHFPLQSWEEYAMH